MALMTSRKCADCEVEYDVLTIRGQVMTIDRDDDEDTCPQCSSANFTVLLRPGTGIELGGVSSQGKIYPYFDRALNCMVNDKHHRKQICKERGLVPADCQIDMEGLASKAESRDDEIRKRYKATQQRYEDDPDFADYRRLRDKGYYKDQAKKQAGG